eukprot:COSAG01_NODE_749_length_13846_cov_205.366097_8_plen_164_part_00
MCAHVSKFKFNCDEVDKKIPKPLPQNLNHFLLIVGKPGSSKTTLILNLIAKRGKNYNKRFDRVYLWSPSLCTIDDCPFEELPDDQKFEDLTEANLLKKNEQLAKELNLHKMNTDELTNVYERVGELVGNTNLPRHEEQLIIEFKKLLGVESEEQLKQLNSYRF